MHRKPSMGSKESNPFKMRKKPGGSSASKPNPRKQRRGDKGHNAMKNKSY